MHDALEALLAADEDARARLGAVEARQRARLAELRGELARARDEARTELGDTLARELEAIRDEAARTGAERATRRARFCAARTTAIAAETAGAVERVVALILRTGSPEGVR